MVAYLSQTVASVSTEVVPVVTQQGAHIDITKELLAFALFGTLSIIGFLLWNIYSGVRREMSKIFKTVEGFQCEAQECRDSLPEKYADKRHVDDVISKLFERQDRLRENLPVNYMTRIEIMQLFDALRAQLSSTRSEIITLLQQLLREKNT